jgi:hypothetical protein
MSSAHCTPDRQPSRDGTRWTAVRLDPNDNVATSQLTPNPLATCLMASISMCIADEMPAEDL